MKKGQRKSKARRAVDVEKANAVRSKSTRTSQNDVPMGRDGVRRARGRSREDASFPVAPPRAELPGDYLATLADMKRRIQDARLRVVFAANTAMVGLYWDIGRMILDRQSNAGWGARVIDRLSADLRDAYPDMQGFSPRNLKYMRAFASAWPDAEIVQRVVARLPWRQNIALLERLDNPETRLWYAEQALQQSWSQPILRLHIDSQAHERHGKAISNFPTTLPPGDSDMARQVFKDPYLFDFLGTADPRREAEVEQALVDHIQRFLLEMGTGFAFLSAADDLLRHPDDKPTIGLLLCRSKNKLVVEYALRSLAKPIGVAEWETKLVEKLPDDLRGSLPTVEEIEAELSEEGSGGST